MKKCILLILLCAGWPLLGHADGLLAIDNPANNGSGIRVYANVEAFEGNDQVAMRQYGAGWQGAYSPRPGSNIGLLAANAETGIQWQGYRLGALYRADALVQANRDTSDLVQQYATHGGYDIGRTYALNYQITGFEADGAHLSRSFQLKSSQPWQINVGFGLSYLHGQRVKIQTVTGQIVTINSQDFNAAANEISSDSTINVSNLDQFNAPFGRLAGPSGTGYAVDAGITIRHQATGATLEVAVTDLTGYLDWTNLPTNATVYNNATKTYGPDGYVQFNPLATRTSSYQNLSQRLDPKLRVAASYPVGNFYIQGSTDYTQGYWFPQTAVGYQINQQWSVKADIDWHFNTFGLALQHSWFVIGLRTDSLDLNKAKAYGLTAGIHIPL